MCGKKELFGTARKFAQEALETKFMLEFYFGWQTLVYNFVQVCLISEVTGKRRWYIHLWVKYFISVLHHTEAVNTLIWTHSVNMAIHAFSAL